VPTAPKAVSSITLSPRARSQVSSVPRSQRGIRVDIPTDAMLVLPRGLIDQKGKAKKWSGYLPTSDTWNAGRISDRCDLHRRLWHQLMLSSSSSSGVGQTIGRLFRSHRHGTAIRVLPRHARGRRTEYRVPLAGIFGCPPDRAASECVSLSTRHDPGHLHRSRRLVRVRPSGRPQHARATSAGSYLPTLRILALRSSSPAP